jgi:hypothetical protein
MTSSQLISQIQLSNMPAILMGMILGILTAPAIGGWMCKIIFSLFGIRKLEFAISPVWMLLSAAGIMAVALLSAGISGLQVRSLKPVEMIMEE